VRLIRAAGQKRGDAAGEEGDGEDSNTRWFHTLHFPLTTLRLRRGRDFHTMTNRHMVECADFSS
jgi:hypothetical protein